MHYDRLISHPSSFISCPSNSPFKEIRRQNRVNEPITGSCIKFKNTALWIIMQCRLVEVLTRFRVTYCFLRQGRKLNESRNYYQALLVAWFLLVSCFLRPSMETVISSETSLYFYRNSRGYLSDDVTITATRTSTAVCIKLFINFLIIMPQQIDCQLH